MTDAAKDSVLDGDTARAIYGNYAAAMADAVKPFQDMDDYFKTRAIARMRRSDYTSSKRPANAGCWWLAAAIRPARAKVARMGGCPPSCQPATPR